MSFRLFFPRSLPFFFSSRFHFSSFRVLSSPFLPHFPAAAALESSHCHATSRLFSSPTLHPIPPLSSTLRRFFMLVHPDLFTLSPRHQAVNAENVQRLNSFLTELKATDSSDPYPARQFLNLSFFIKKRVGDQIQSSLPLGAERSSPAKRAVSGGQRKRHGRVGEIIPGEYHLIHQTIALTGGECRATVERGLGELFDKVALPSQFEWDADYWKLKPPVDIQQERERQQREQQEE